MSEDKDAGSLDTPTGDAADQWLRSESRKQGEIIDDPNIEIVKSLYRLGTQILETADKIDLNNPATLHKTSRDKLSLVRDKGDGQPMYISFSPFQRYPREGVNLTLYNQEVDQIGLYSRDIFTNFQEFFGDTPIYIVSLSSHEDHEPNEGLHTYALSADGECVRASWEDTFIKDKAKYTKEINPGELEMVGAAMNILRGKLEKFSPTAPV